MNVGQPIFTKTSRMWAAYRPHTNVGGLPAAYGCGRPTGRIRMWDVFERRKCHPKQRGIALLQPTFHFVYLLDADCHYLYVYAQYALPFPVELVAKKKYNDNLFTF